jgi:hypothetical protein
VICIRRYRAVYDAERQTERAREKRTRTVAGICGRRNCASLFVRATSSQKDEVEESISFDKAHNINYSYSRISYKSEIAARDPGCYCLPVVIAVQRYDEGRGGRRQERRRVNRYSAMRWSQFCEFTSRVQREERRIQRGTAKEDLMTRPVTSSIDPIVGSHILHSH